MIKFNFNSKKNGKTMPLRERNFPVFTILKHVLGEMLSFEYQLNVQKLNFSATKVTTLYRFVCRIIEKARTQSFL